MVRSTIIFVIILHLLLFCAEVGAHAKGFSPTNIKYFKYFYELYSSLLGKRLSNNKSWAVSFFVQKLEDLSDICFAKEFRCVIA